MLRREKVRQPYIVRIEKSDDLGARVFDAEIACRPCAGIPLANLKDVFEQAADRTFEFLGIGRAVVHYDDLVLAKLLGEHGLSSIVSAELYAGITTDTFGKVPKMFEPMRFL